MILLLIPLTPAPDPPVVPLGPRLDVLAVPVLESVPLVPPVTLVVPFVPTLGVVVPFPP